MERVGVPNNTFRRDTQVFGLAKGKAGKHFPVYNKEIYYKKKKEKKSKEIFRLLKNH